MTPLPPPQSGNKYSISILSTHSSDSSPSLLVAFPDQRYLFNTPESISRIALQSKVGLRKVGNVFLGSVGESAGLPGFILSSVEAGNSRIEIVGPGGTDHYLASCRFFTRRDKLSLKVSTPTASSDPSPSSSLPPPTHSDSNLNIYSFTLKPSAPIAPALPLDATRSSSPPSSSSLKRKRSQSRSPSPRSKSPPGNRFTSEHFDPASPSFQPSRLKGNEARVWREMVIRDMFRGTSFDTPPPSSSTTSEDSVMQDAPSAPPLPTTTTTSSREPRKGPTPAYLPQPLPPFSGSNDAISYLAVGPVQLGKFLPTQAEKLGVKKGKMFARLKNGERVWVRPEVSLASTSVSREKAGDKKKESKKERVKRLKEEKTKMEELEKGLVDGEGEGFWVTPEQCMEEGQDASAFLVLNLPSPEYLDSLPTTIPPTLLNRETLGSTTSLRTIFYLLGPGVLSDSRFNSYLSSLSSHLPSEISHQVSSADFIPQGKDEITFGPSALLNLRLSKLDSKIFNIPHYSFDPSFTTSSSESLIPLSANTHFSSSTALQPSETSPLGGEIRSFNFQLGSIEAETQASRLKGVEKPKELQERGVKAWEEYLRKTGEVKELVEAENEKRQKEEEMDEKRKKEGDIKVTPLGTGSAIPSKYRNVSSTLIHIPVEGSTEGEEEYILLDAGEGTWGQLARRFGTERARSVLRKTGMIFISHLHQDHHAGVSTLLRERARLDSNLNKVLTIVAPSNARTYLFEQHQLFNLGFNSPKVRFLDNFLLEPGKSLREGSPQAENYRQLLELLGLEAVVAVPVLHRCRAWGIVITHRSGWRVVFSGDTMPCEALVEHGQEASLLIHEATIEDDLPDVAAQKGHSTFAQAIDIATRMRARHLILTHFSARYPKLPPESTIAPSSTTDPDGDGESSEVVQLVKPVIATAFDLMTLRLGDFWKLERYRGALDSLLSWDEADEGKEELQE
ncbi:tRNase Z [Sporobolomyces salmoneus]|uniref:tRNase Z n=1 Tax=Sporobolomyces salmoneus TaxID=183962 RepID=UPI00317E154B